MSAPAADRQVEVVIIWRVASGHVQQTCRYLESLGFFAADSQDAAAGRPSILGYYDSLADAEQHARQITDGLRQLGIEPLSRATVQLD